MTSGLNELIDYLDDSNEDEIIKEAYEKRKKERLEKEKEENED